MTLNLNASRVSFELDGQVYEKELVIPELGRGLSRRRRMFRNTNQICSKNNVKRSSDEIVEIFCKNSGSEFERKIRQDFRGFNFQCDRHHMQFSSETSIFFAECSLNAAFLRGNFHRDDHTVRTKCNLFENQSQIYGRMYGQSAWECISAHERNPSTEFGCTSPTERIPDHYVHVVQVIVKISHRHDRSIEFHKQQITLYDTCAPYI